MVTGCEQGEVLLGKLLYAEEDYENALEYLQDLDSPAEVHYFIAAAELALAGTIRSRRSDQQGQLGKALAHGEKFLALNPEVLEAYEVVGEISFLLEHYQKATEMYAVGVRLAHQQERCDLEFEMLMKSGYAKTNFLERHEEAIEELICALEVAFKVEDLERQAMYLSKGQALLQSTVYFVHGITNEYSGEEELTNSCNTDMPTSLHVDVSAPMPISLTRAKALYVLGEAKILNGLFNEAHQYCKQAMSLLDDERHSFSDEQTSLKVQLLCQLQYLLAQISATSCKCEEALWLFRNCKGMVQSERIRLKCDIESASALVVASRCHEAVEILTQAMEEFQALLGKDWDLNTRFLLALGQALWGIGNSNEATSRLETAMSIFKEMEAPDPLTVSSVNLTLFYAYMEKQRIWDAIQLVKSYEVIVKAASTLGKHRIHKKVWQFMSALTSAEVANYEQTSDTLTKLLEQSQMDLDWMLKVGVLTLLARAYMNLGDFDSALDKYEEAIHLVPEANPWYISDILVNRAGLYKRMGEEAANPDMQKAAKDENNWKAYHEFGRAITIMESFSYLDRNSLAMAYAGQAAVLCYFNKTQTASEKLEKARDYAGENWILMAKIKYVKAYILALEGSLAEAQSENREAAILFATLQMEMQELGSAWVSLLGGQMKHVFIFMQKLFNEQLDHLQALIWAERGRMRLYFRVMEQQLAESSSLLAQQDALWFDKDDDKATECIHRAMNSCASGTAIIEYTYAEAEGFLYMYVVREGTSTKKPLAVSFQQIVLRDFFRIQANSRSGNTLKLLIRRTRTAIVRRMDDKAKQGLSVLFNLLVKPLWLYVEDCSTLIFAPHEDLSLVPFAALYDSERKAFLIERKAVGITPSIRALQNCLLHQWAFEEGMRLRTNSTAFVAADPVPMGLGLGQLGGAAQEARNVAKILCVEPVIGAAMTKDAVIDGLCNAEVVVLVTHGIVDSAMYPQGAVVMQGQGRGHRDHLVPTSAPLLRYLVSRGRTETAEACIQTMDRASEVLTADDIGKLGRIRAGLVVLSACRTGEGQVSSEGLLGLGRAVLQAGASSVALMLWKVDDASTKDLVTGLFQQLVDKGQTIVTAVQATMLQMLRSGSHIYNWAPLIVVGSPTVRLVMG